MPLVKFPVLTPAKLAANRANARKSTGPRSYRGKCRVTLNALRHGRCASPKLFRSRLAAVHEEVALYDWIYKMICDVVRPVGKAEWRTMNQMACRAWCFLARPQGRRPLPTRSSLWCQLRLQRRHGGSGRYAVKASVGRVLNPTAYWLKFDESTYLKFWVRRRRQPSNRGPDTTGKSVVWMAGWLAGSVVGRLRLFLGSLRNKATMLFRIISSMNYASEQ